MNRNIKMIVFVVVLGFVTSFLLLGMDLLTRDRIIANEQALLKSSILDGFGIAYNFNNIHDVFEDKVDVDDSIEGFIFYIDPVTNYVAFEFEGDGVWGPIKGVITLKDDFETIVRITILEQQETPGLGGVVAERNYLNKFVNKVMNVRLTKTPTDPLSDVDVITGGTRTSERFDALLNLAYDLHKAAWASRIGG
jgi:Na+-transporting NADH:ubiquinone oxidoreductase subunit C